MTVDPDPLYAIVRVEDLVPRDRVLVCGYYYRVTAIEHAGDDVFLTLDDGLRRRLVVGSTLGCELRAVS